MNYRKSLATHILSAAALFVLAGQASAEKGSWQEIETEINACVAAIADHANYDDATHVRTMDRRVLPICCLGCLRGSCQ